jgi:HK97 gp10 family phage protein
VKITVKGVDALMRKLDTIDQLHQKDALADALADGGVVLVDEAKRRVPVQSGDLRDSLHVGGYKELTPAFRKIGIYGELPGPKGRGRSVGVLVGSTLPYAPLVELGTKHAAPEPYLRPAGDVKENEIRDAVDARIQEIIDEA